jgi:hypothetical protein
MTDVWYRYEDHLVSTGYDYERDCSSGSRVEVRLLEFVVLKTTPKGVWLDMGSARWDAADKKFVLRDARKRYACPTKEEARASFIARKKAQIRIHEARVAGAKEALEAIGHEEPKPERKRPWDTRGWDPNRDLGY